MFTASFDLDKYGRGAKTEQGRNKHIRHCDTVVEYKYYAHKRRYGKYSPHAVERKGDKALFYVSLSDRYAYKAKPAYATKRKTKGA